MYNQVALRTAPDGFVLTHTQNVLDRVKYNRLMTVSRFSAVPSPSGFHASILKALSGKDLTISDLFTKMVRLRNSCMAASALLQAYPGFQMFNSLRGFSDMKTVTEATLATLAEQWSLKMNTLDPSTGMPSGNPLEVKNVTSDLDTSLIEELLITSAVSSSRWTLDSPAKAIQLYTRLYENLAGLTFSEVANLLQSIGVDMTSLRLQEDSRVLHIALLPIIDFYVQLTMQPTLIDKVIQRSLHTATPSMNEIRAGELQTFAGLLHGVLVSPAIFMTHLYNKHFSILPKIMNIPYVFETTIVESELANLRLTDILNVEACVNKLTETSFTYAGATMREIWTDVLMLPKEDTIIQRILENIGMLKDSVASEVDGTVIKFDTVKAKAEIEAIVTGPLTDSTKLFLVSGNALANVSYYARPEQVAALISYYREVLKRIANMAVEQTALHLDSDVATKLKGQFSYRPWELGCKAPYWRPDCRVARYLGKDGQYTLDGSGVLPHHKTLKRMQNEEFLGTTSNLEIKQKFGAETNLPMVDLARAETLNSLYMPEYEFLMPSVLRILHEGPINTNAMHVRELVRRFDDVVSQIFKITDFLLFRELFATLRVPTIATHLAGGFLLFRISDDTIAAAIHAALDSDLKGDNVLDPKVYAGKLYFYQHTKMIIANLVQMINKAVTLEDIKKFSGDPVKLPSGDVLSDSFLKINVVQGLGHPYGVKYDVLLKAQLKDPNLGVRPFVLIRDGNDPTAHGLMFGIPVLSIPKTTEKVEFGLFDVGVPETRFIGSSVEVVNYIDKFFTFDKLPLPFCTCPAFSEKSADRNYLITSRAIHATRKIFIMDGSLPMTESTPLKGVLHFKVADWPGNRTIPKLIYTHPAFFSAGAELPAESSAVTAGDKLGKEAEAVIKAMDQVTPMTKTAGDAGAYSGGEKAALTTTTSSSAKKNTAKGGGSKKSDDKAPVEDTKVDEGTESSEKK